MAASGVDGGLVLADGRVLEYWQGGDPEGRGVIFHPGTPVSRVLGRWAHDAAVAAGVRLITMNRPGYGGSTTTAGARPSLLNVGRDTASLADHLGLDGYAVGGGSGGGPFAAATAVADPGAVHALGVVGGVGPWRLLLPPSEFPEDRACLELLDAGDPAGAWDCMVRTAEEELRGLSVDDAVGWILEGDASPLVDDPGFRAVWADNMRVVMGNLDGYAFDNLAWGGAWDVDPRDVVAPSLLWYGEADERCPLTYAEWYVERIAGAELITFPEEGHIDVIDAHWPEVFAGLLRVWA
jgi:pimeloyl-ACP methyl ester carboxylesterase